MPISTTKPQQQQLWLIQLLAVAWILVGGLDILYILCVQCTLITILSIHPLWTATVLQVSIYVSMSVHITGVCVSTITQCFSFVLFKSLCRKCLVGWKYSGEILDQVAAGNLVQWGALKEHDLKQKRNLLITCTQ